MRHDELIGQVQARAGLPDRGSAEHAVRATLETLAERLPEGTAEHLAAQLPQEVAEHLQRITSARERGPYAPSSAERFDLTAFAGRIAWRAGASEDTALRQAAAVLEVLDGAVSPEQMDKAAAGLPPDIRELLPSSRAD